MWLIWKDCYKANKYIFLVKVIGKTESERQHGDLEEKGTLWFETKLFMPPRSFLGVNAHCRKAG